MRQLWIQLVRAITAAHDCGINLGDLSFTNILVNEGQIKICDLETASRKGSDTQVGLHTPGMSTFGISDQANDYYALGAIMLGSIMLVHGFTGFYQSSRDFFLNELANDLNLPSDLVALINGLMDRPEHFKETPDLTIKSIEQLPFNIFTASCCTPRLSLPIEQRFDMHRRGELRSRVREVVNAIICYLHGVADTAREDRLFPADLWVFETNPLSIAYGAMGVLYALHHLGSKVPTHLMEWVLQHPISNDEYPPGLYLGQAGISWVLSELGYLEFAVKTMRSARRHDTLWQSPNVLHGAAGYGLACLNLWQKGAGNEFLDEAVQVGKYLFASCVSDERGVYWPNENSAVAIGYAYGGSGIALFLLYLALATGDSNQFQLGRQALDFDLAQGVWLDGKFAGFPSSITTGSELPDTASLNCYWDVGSAGIGTALVRYLAVTSDPILQDWLEPLVSDASRKYTAFPQLFRGLAGLGNFLLDVWHQTGNERHLLAAWHVAEGVLLFQIDCQEGVAFPGEQTRRESADFATGAAGVGLFLSRLLKSEKSIQGNFNFVIDELLSCSSVFDKFNKY
ncbi:MAG: protein kinase/lanthionine synthetase C family protein [Leptolyngbyaceae cyanobacterium RM1_405_57]|nr:protein kinase/lanthionine synthetase C family protein [Leptolyngbyaceae cyanobacterium RM1_405_57]